MNALRPARLRVLIAAPLPADVGAVAAVLGTAGHEVLTAYRLDAVVARLVSERPDVLVVDPAIGEGSAADLVSRLGGYSDAPLLVLADLVDETLVVEALGAGAVDVVGRPLRPLELLARIAAAARRGGPSGAESGTLPDGLRVDAAQRHATVDGRDLGLTPIELDLLAAMAARRGGVVDHRLLLRAAWPDPASVDPETLRTHLARLNAKLVEAGHPGLRNVRSRGYAIRVEGAAAERWGTMAT
jgi:two-component system KDP operon response regulator KdpE